MPVASLTFTAIDFETASTDPTSACALGLVRVERGKVRQRRTFLIRPPTRRFDFTHVHGLTWRHVQGAPTFAQIWPEVRRLLAGVDFLAAHNATFDGGVLRACQGLLPRARSAALPPFECTVRVARNVWGIYPTRLNHVAEHLGLPLQHHDAASDAEACAGIVLAAAARGWRHTPRASAHLRTLMSAATH